MTTPQVHKVHKVQTGLPPGPADPRKVFVAMRRNTLKFFVDTYTEYGDFAYYQIGPSRVYLISDPAAIRTVLVDLNDKMERTRLTHETLGKFMGMGLTVSAGDLHKRQRRTIQPVFTPNWIKTYADTMVAATLEMMASWRDGQTLDIAAEMMSLTMKIVYRTIFGDHDSQADQEARQAILLLQQYSGDMLTGSTRITEAECDAARQTLEQVVDSLIADHRRHEQSDFLGLLVKAVDPITGDPIPDAQIRAEAINFYVAGQETTANALAWTWHMLATHPDIQARLSNEIVSVLGHERITAEHLAQMPYTERVIKESMRIYPPAWLIGRRPTESVEINGYQIDHDATIAICSYAFHRNPQVFPEPETFNPDRFLVDPPKYTYLPFGAGPHVCIGQPFSMLETSLILATVAQRFHIESHDTQPVEPDPQITLRPKHGISVRLVARDIS